MTHQEQHTLLKECGRELAEKWLASAVDDAENDEQVINQIVTLYSAAISILAHSAFNINKNVGHNYNEILTDCLRELRDEIEMISDSAKFEEVMQ